MLMDKINLVYDCIPYKNRNMPGLTSYDICKKYCHHNGKKFLNNYGFIHAALMTLHEKGYIGKEEALIEKMVQMIKELCILKNHKVE